MTTDFRALCAELLDEFVYYTDWSDAEELKDRARAALAEPVGEGPSDEEIILQASKFFAYSDAHMGDPAGWGGSDADLFAFARAILTRWGNHPAKPD